ITEKVANTSTTAFKLQTAGGTVLLTGDSTDERLYVGPTAGDTVGALLVLGNKTNAGDPAGVVGAMYFNSSMNEFRCYYTNGWLPCANDPIDQSYDINDDFVSGTTTTGQIGALGW